MIFNPLSEILTTHEVCQQYKVNRGTLRTMRLQRLEADVDYRVTKETTLFYKKSVEKVWGDPNESVQMSLFDERLL